MVLRRFNYNVTADVNMLKILHYVLSMPYYELFFVTHIAMILGMPQHKVRRSLERLCKIGFICSDPHTNPIQYTLRSSAKDIIKELGWTFLGSKNWL